MSINNIIATSDPLITIPTNYGVQQIKYKDVIIDGNIYVKEDDHNRINYTLQCYEPFRARFLPQPVLNDLNHDVYTIFQDDGEESIQDDYFHFNAPGAEDNFELDIDDTKIVCVSTGLYLVIIKVTKDNSTFVLRTELEIEDDLLPETISTTPYLAGTRPYATNYSATLKRIQEGEVIRLFRNYFPAESELSIVEGDVSTLTFIKINADIP